jgi:hypothetical protein
MDPRTLFWHLAALSVLQTVSRHDSHASYSGGTSVTIPCRMAFKNCDIFPLIVIPNTTCQGSQTPTTKCTQIHPRTSMTCSFDEPSCRYHSEPYIKLHVSERYVRSYRLIRWFYLHRLESTGKLGLEAYPYTVAMWYTQSIPDGSSHLVSCSLGSKRALNEIT